MRKIAALPLLAGILMLGHAQAAQTAQATSVPAAGASLQDAAAQLGHDYDTLYRAKDAAGMASLYAADGELVSPGGKLVNGHDALVAYYRARFASGATGHKITVLETHALGDAGYSVANFSVSVPGKGTGQPGHQESGHIAAVYAHDAGGWHFALVEPSTTPASGG